jgi:branched-chain amino acid transport system permease protein
MENTVQTIIDAISLGALYALLALGIALIFGIMNLINFAYGELMMIGGYSLVMLASAAAPVMILTTLIIVVIAALLMDRIAFRPVRAADATTLLITSFALSYLLQNLAIMIFGSLPRTTGVGSGLDQSIEIGGVAVSELHLTVIAVAVLLIAGLVFLIRRTGLGIQMRAAAEDFEMARLLGVNADRIIAVGFAISGLLAAVAGFFLVAESGSVSPTFGVSAVLIAFIATIVGGLGSLQGAVLAGFGLGAVTVAFQDLLPDGLVPYRDAFVFLVVLLTLILRPAGLIPQRARAARV